MTETYVVAGANLAGGTAAATLRSDGEAIRYDKVLVATGLRDRTLGVPGGHLGGVHTLRTVADDEAIRARTAGATRAVVIGMGFIGAEVAASLRLCGLDVVAVE